MNKIFFFILSIILLNSCFSSKNVLDGASAFKLKQYQRANELLQQEIEDEKNEGKRAKKAFMIAQSYEYLLQPHLATQWYEKANQSGYGVQSKLALAYAYKINKEYTKSLSLFKELSKYNTLTQECNIQIRGLEDIMKGNQNMGFSYRILNLNASGQASLYAPVFYDEEDLLVTSDGADAEGEIIYNWTGRKHADLFLMSKYGGTLRPIGEPFNTSHNEGAATLSKSKNEMFFTRCYNRQPNTDEFCSIFYTSKDNEDRWSTPVELPFFNGKTNFGQPTLVENDSVLIFSSLSEGGQNGYDLWYSDRFDGAWSEPYPMPSNINTQGNEYFPTSDGDTLYFSSDFHPGQGGLDIFKTWLADGKWVNPQRLESPINSSFDDYSYIIDKSIKPSGNTMMKGFFTSNRSGKGIDDLYAFEKLSVTTIEEKPAEVPIVTEPIVVKEDSKPKPEVEKPEAIFQLYLAGRVVDAETKGNAFLRARPIPNARIVWRERDTIIQRFTADRNGVFIKTSESGKLFEFIASADSFLSRSVTVVTTNVKKPESSDFLTINFEIPLERIIRNKEIVLNNIYYDLDQSFIRNDAKPTLDSLATILQLNPTIQIELGSHTDCRGDEEYNLSLSQRRAQAAVDYLMTRGIDSSRLSARGYGETSFAVDCLCERCTEADHQKNRRTTFKIK